MTLDRSAVRKQYAAALQTALQSYVDKVYDYQVATFGTKSKVVLVTSSGTDRGDSDSSSLSDIWMDVYTFVLYSSPPVKAEGLFDSGDDVVIPLTDTTFFEVGKKVVIDEEVATVTEVVTGESITVDHLELLHIEPEIFYWHESLSEDFLDFLEYMITDVTRVENDADTWLKITRDGRSEPSVVEISGNAFRYELIPVKATIMEY